MENTTLDLLSVAPEHAGGRWTASAVVGTVVGRLAQEFPELPVGVIIAASVRSLRELRRVPLTTLLDAPFDGVRELVEERSRRALRDSDAVRVPRQLSEMRRGDIDNGHGLLAADDMPVLRLLPSQMSFAEIAVALGSNAAEVRTRAIGICRRLGAVSRAEAVERAGSRGLLQ
jgi:DNA-binding CsgD family transcriptional regulator